jgi:O-antigen/teichoic acid export membrane protein
MAIPQQLKNRVLKASMWAIANTLVAHGLRLISNLILTRLLVPEMFGLMSIISAMMMGLYMMTDLGLGAHIVQNKRADSDYLDTSWTLGLLRGMVIWLLSILVAICLYIAQRYNWLPNNTVYAESMLPFVIPVFSLTVLINAFEPTWTALDSRNLNQARLVKIGILSQVVGIIFMIALAWYSRTIWALVIGSLGSSLARSFIVNFCIKGPRNRIHLEKESLSNIFHFGKWLFLSSIIGFLANTSDQFILGGLISSRELGVYNIALVIVVGVSQSVSALLSSVAYPALSEVIRERKHDLIRVYYRFRVSFDSGTLFLSGFLLIAGQVIINIMYDERYTDAGWMIGILSFGLLTIRYQIANQCFMALGYTKIMTIHSIVRTIAIFVFLPIGYRFYGLVGAIWATTLVNFATFPISIYYKKMHGILDIKKEFVTFPMIFVGMAAGWLFNQLAHFAFGSWI